MNSPIELAQTMLRLYERRPRYAAVKQLAGTVVAINQVVLAELYGDTRDPAAAVQRINEILQEAP